MLLKNGVIFLSANILNKIVSFDFPVKTAYKIKKNCEALNKQLEFINKQRNELINKYGEDGKIDSKNEEAISKFTNDFNEILNIEEDININKIDISELEGIKLSISDLTNIDFMINTEHVEGEE